MIVLHHKRKTTYLVLRSSVERGGVGLFACPNGSFLLFSRGNERIWLALSAASAHRYLTKSNYVTTSLLSPQTLTLHHLPKIASITYYFHL